MTGQRRETYATFSRADMAGQVGSVTFPYQS